MSTAPEHELLTIAGDVRVAVPRTPGLLTAYVLREQGDWFEDEIAFVRRLARPGMNVVDVGANYGVYALSIARLTAPGGALWAVEPARTTAAYLRESVAANGLANVHVVEAGLSNRDGEATLFTEANAEMNTLNPSPGATSAGRETVTIRTLDGLARELHWRDVAFVKLDAEGEEERILEGGRAFLAESEPLCMFEWKHGDKPNKPLMEAFPRLGMALYRLQPGTCALVPIAGPNSGDPFQLNLFAASPARAARCAAAGLLVERVPAPGELPATDRAATEAWLHALPYARACQPAWSRAEASTRGGLAHAIERYAQSRDERVALPVRAGALDAALAELAGALSAQPRPAVLLTLARVAAAVGQRMLAVKALDELVRLLVSGAPLDLGEPFVSPNPRFDDIAPGEGPDALQRWCAAAVVEQLEKLVHYSSFYTREASLPRLELFQTLGFPSPEMARRLALVEARVGRGAAKL